MTNSRRILLSISLFILLGLTQGHARFKCPPPRDANDANGHHDAFSNTGNKHGPCGPMSGNWGFGGFTKLSPGKQTLTWEESISHKGSPFRISILDENEIERIVLLDHIPHNDDTKPIPYVESSYSPYSITVEIPDIQCSKCSIRVLYVMTDKSVACGLAQCVYYADDTECSGHTDPAIAQCAGTSTNKPCKYANSCFSNYHTCTDVAILGSKPLNSSLTAGNVQPGNWPYKNLTTYGDEAAKWQNGFLVGVPSEFTNIAGVDLCTRN
jgi:hypothetical protein